MRTALTIAGSDSGGGAGIQADLKTFAAFHVFGTTAITAITAQNTRGVTRVDALAPDLVTAQIEAVVTDIGADAVKIGMLATAAIAHAVADALERHGLTRVVLDTVMIAKGGEALIDDEAVTVLRTRLLRHALVVTPNVPEAEALTSVRIEDRDGQRRAAAALVDLGAKAAIVKGGHLEGSALDVMFDGTSFLELDAVRVNTRHTHGTGCTFSAAIAARLALGDALVDAVKAAKGYVTEAIRKAPGIGGGHGPVRHDVQTGGSESLY